MDSIFAFNNVATGSILGIAKILSSFFVEVSMLPKFIDGTLPIDRTVKSLVLLIESTFAGACTIKLYGSVITVVLK